MLLLAFLPSESFAPSASAAHQASHAAPRAAVLASEADGPSPEEWREFRQKLVSGGLKLTTDVADEEAAAPSVETVRRTVAPKNEALLQSQSDELYKEYISGGWAHPSPVEAGGLMMRMPLPAQFLTQMRDGSTDFWPAKLREIIKAELPEAGEGETRTTTESDALMTKFTSNTMYCYRVAETMMEERIGGIGAQADEQGRINARDLKPEELELLAKFSESQNAWQQVCLILAATDGAAAGSSVVLNRPLAKGIDDALALRILNGAGRTTAVDSAGLVAAAKKLEKAFGDEAAVYWGGPERQEEPALLVHGIDGLAGSKELAPGTRIYSCSGLGVEAAADAVLEGRCAPLDFRWFIGRHATLRCAKREWAAAACARPVALKQCLGLPKPLWHEVMELCGGSLAELSQVELQKRDDLREDEDD